MSALRELGDSHLPDGAVLAPGYLIVAHLRSAESLDLYDIWSVERHCRCVAKVLRADARGRARRRLLREGRLLERLSHPHIVRAYATFASPIPMIILETLTGATLAHLLKDKQPLSGEDIAYLGQHLCSAMHYLHGHGYLHLDLKPSNVICDRRLAKVIDFSIARRPGLGRAGVGTRQYMAPEQARGDRLTTAVDVWGIGAVLYEASTGRAPFQAFEGRRYDQLERRATPVGEGRRISRSLESVIAACLQAEPERRPTIEELERGLRVTVA